MLKIVAAAAAGQRQETPKVQTEDLNWVGSRVKQSVLGICPFCGAIVDIDIPHRCGKMPDLGHLQRPLFKEFESDPDALMLFGPRYLVAETEARIRAKYPKTKFYLIFN